MKAPIVFDEDGCPFFWKENTICRDFAQIALPEEYKKYRKLDGDHWYSLLDSEFTEYEPFQGDIYNANIDWTLIQYSDYFDESKVTKQLFHEFEEFVNWVKNSGIRYYYDIQVW